MFDDQYPMPVITFYHGYGLKNATFSAGPGTTNPPRSRKNLSPIYEIRIGGLCKENYAAVNDYTNNSFQNILASKDLYQDHPRQDKLIINAVRQLKPGFSGQEEASSDWFCWSE